MVGSSPTSMPPIPPTESPMTRLRGGDGDINSVSAPTLLTRIFGVVYSVTHTKGVVLVVLITSPQ